MVCRHELVEAMHPPQHLRLVFERQRKGGQAFEGLFRQRLEGVNVITPSDTDAAEELTYAYDDVGDRVASVENGTATAYLVDGRALSFSRETIEGVD